MSLANEEEKLALVQFRNRVSDVLGTSELEDDMFLLRWIRAREMNLDKAEEMLRNALKWRKEKQVDTIFERKMDPFILNNYPRWVDGFDKQGRPVYTAAYGEWDLRKAVNLGLVPQFLEYTTEGFERLLQAIRESNERLGQPQPGQPPITQIVGIFDFEGFAWAQLISWRAVQGLLQLAAIYEAYYPEILHTCYFINCPSLISKVLSLLKPIVAPKTMAKIKVFGTNKEEWKGEILKEIDEDQLREQFGGTIRRNSKGNIHS